MNTVRIDSLSVGDRRPAPQTVGLRAEAAATARAIGGALLLALVLRVVLYQPFTIPSASMEPGLVEGDYILVSKFSYGWSRASLPFNPPVGAGRLFGRSPDQGDVIVFNATAGGFAVIKRVVGVPGDHIRLAGGTVFVNGRPLPQAMLEGEGEDGTARVREQLPSGRSYVILDRGPGRQGDDTAGFDVPARHYFVLGDNRDNSLDSRWPAGQGQGLIPAENILGEAQLILLSWRPGASLFKPWTWLSLRDGRALKRL